MLTTEIVLEKLDTHKNKLKSYGVKRIGLFGSLTRGEQTPESDLDILVEFERDQKTFDNYMDLKIFLEELFACSVDLVVKEAIKPALKEAILESVKYAAGV
ncbi:MAG: nucleotidyltransferase family protein [Candidatus Methanospirareceae archaeon]